MDYVLVDTDVASFALKGDTRADRYRRHLEGKVLAISFQSVAELLFWAKIRNWGQKRYDELLAHTDKFVVIPFTKTLCAEWADVRSESQKEGSNISVADCWTAASARLYRIPLVTHNRKHFEDVDGLTVISES